MDRTRSSLRAPGTTRPDRVRTTRDTKRDRSHPATHGVVEARRVDFEYFVPRATYHASYQRAFITGR